MANLDFMTEMEHGKGAIRRVAKLIMSHTNMKAEATLIAGVAVPELPIEDCLGREMWECEIIIIPIRKYRQGDGYKGHRIDQLLTGPYYDPDQWGEKYFENKGDGS